MILIDGRPVLDHIIAALARAGVRRFVLAAGYLGEVVARYYATTRQAGCQIEVVTEADPRGTAGALRWCADRLEDDFVFAYGDVFVDFDARRLLAALCWCGVLIILGTQTWSWRMTPAGWSNSLIGASRAGSIATLPTPPSTCFRAGSWTLSRKGDRLISGPTSSRLRSLLARR
jgi:hypothetical protein